MFISEMQVATKQGWVRLDEFKKNVVECAQFDSVNRKFEYVLPTHVHAEPYNDSMCSLELTKQMTVACANEHLAVAQNKITGEWKWFESDLFPLRDHLQYCLDPFGTLYAVDVYPVQRRLMHYQGEAVEVFMPSGILLVQRMGMKALWGAKPPE